MLELRRIRALDVAQGHVLLDDAGFDEGVHLFGEENSCQLDDGLH
jgi:hypothetical protein